MSRHRFSEAPGQPDGIRLSRWRRRRSGPLGGDFDYTDATDLTGEFGRDGGSCRLRPPWHQRLLKKLLRRKNPVAWVVVDSDEAQIPQAHLMTPTRGEVRISPIHTRSLAVVYDDAIVLLADDYEKNQGPWPTIG